MRTKSISDLVHLSEKGAVARHFDGRNYRVVRRMLLATTPLAVVMTLVLSTSGHLWQGLSWIPVLAVSTWIFFARSTALFERSGRQMTMLYLALVVLAMAFSFLEPEAAYAFAGFVLPALLLLFRLHSTEYLAVLGVDAAAMVWCVLRPGMPEKIAAKAGMAFVSLVFMAVVLSIAIRVTRGRRMAFLTRWRFEAAKDRDSRRMRTELEDAREIQLSMLPEGAPDLDWIDFSSVSLPASEVGGDYFDYFELAGSRLAIVIADVAGHGVASGLVLSGIRSSLHLLQDELIRPVEVLGKLDRMLRETVGGRLFVTLQIAVLDPGLGRLTVANAGHPPLFVVSADGKAHRLGGNSLPLGTRLSGDATEESAALGQGDVLLLFSDGVPEVRNLHDDVFGEERLLDTLRRSRPEAGAHVIRDSLLNALSLFKGDVEQEDDLTLVVAKVAGIT